MTLDSLAGLRNKIVEALFDGALISAALRMEDLARAVAREEVERAAHETPEVIDKPRSDAQVSAGVRVRVTEEAVYAAEEANTVHSTFRDDLEAAAPHMEVTVDREFLRSRLERWTKKMVFHSEAEAFAKILGITITDGDTDA